MPIKFDLDYACIFNSSKNAMSFTEFDSGTIIDVNAAWISATAIACERAIGTTALELGLWVSEAVRADCVARLHQHGSVTEMEIILLPQGVETLYLVQASPVEIEHQRFVLWEFENISARKQLEAETLALKNQLQSTLDAIPDLLFETDLAGRIYHYHSPRTDLLIVPQEQFLGRLFSEILPADAAATCMTALAEANLKGYSTGTHYAITLPHGVFWFELSISKKPGLQLSDCRFVFLVRDITRRKQIEQENLNTNALLRSIVNTVPSRIFWKDRELKYQGCNAAFVADANLATPEDIINKDDFQLCWNR